MSYRWSADSQVFEGAPTYGGSGPARSLPVAQRWGMYLSQRGRDWSSFLTRDEYDRYLGEFTFIRKYSAALYQSALKARSDFEQVKGLAPLYQQLYLAALNANLSLDRGGNLVLRVQRELP